MDQIREKVKGRNPLLWFAVFVIVLAGLAFILWAIGVSPTDDRMTEAEMEIFAQNLLGSVVSCPELPGNISSVEVEKLVFSDIDGDGQKELVLCAWVVRDPFGHGLQQAEEPAP